MSDLYICPAGNYFLENNVPQNSDVYFPVVETCVCVVMIQKNTNPVSDSKATNNYKIAVLYANKNEPLFHVENDNPLKKADKSHPQYKKAIEPNIQTLDEMMNYFSTSNDNDDVKVLIFGGCQELAIPYFSSANYIKYFQEYIEGRKIKKFRVQNRGYSTKSICLFPVPYLSRYYPQVTINDTAPIIEADEYYRSIAFMQEIWSKGFEAKNPLIIASYNKIKSPKANNVSW